MEKRVIDIAGVTSKIKVYLNDKKIESNDFKKYINLYDINKYEDDNIKEDDDNYNDNDDDDDKTSETNKKSNDIIYEEYKGWKIGIIYNPDNTYE